MQVRIAAVGLNHIDLWGFRGMAFAKRQLPLVVGAEACGTVAAVGPGVAGVQIGERVVPYGALTCGACAACQGGRENLCENVGGVCGFHVDGFCRELVNHPARLVVPVPDAVADADAACVAGRLRDRRAHAVRQRPPGAGEWMLVHAAGSGSAASR